MIAIYTQPTRDEAGEKWWSDLKARVVEHNIRMMAQYYTKIRYCSLPLCLSLPLSSSL